MKSKKTPKAQNIQPPLSGADHRAIALLRHIAGESAGHWSYEELGPYIAAARTIIRSKNAFDGGIDTLSVDRYVVNSERFLASADANDRDKQKAGIIRTIIEGNEGTSVTADAWDLMAFMYAVISEATLYGAAVMFELLEGETTRC
jgi:hypothetical protein